MAEIKIKGDISGSTTIKAPDSGSDEIIELSTVLDGKAPLDSPTFTGTPALPDGTTLAGAALTSGKILQIVRATDTSNRSTTSTSYTDASISVSITPTKSTSAVILIWSAHASPTSGVSAYQDMTLTDSSNNQVAGDHQHGSASSTSTYDWATVIAYVTPATTSAVTYKGRFKAASGTTARILNSTYGAGQLFAIEVSA